jgi:hypothetical protein
MFLRRELAHASSKNLILMFPGSIRIMANPSRVMSMTEVEARSGRANVGLSNPLASPKASTSSAHERLKVVSIGREISVSREGDGPWVMSSSEVRVWEGTAHPLVHPGSFMHDCVALRTTDQRVDRVPELTINTSSGSRVQAITLSALRDPLIQFCRERGCEDKARLLLAIQEIQEEVDDGVSPAWGRWFRLTAGCPATDNT